jgi:hypothetical protein
LASVDIGSEFFNAAMKPFEEGDRRMPVWVAIPAYRIGKQYPTVTQIIDHEVLDSASQNFRCDSMRPSYHDDGTVYALHFALRKIGLGETGASFKMGAAKEFSPFEDSRITVKPEALFEIEVEKNIPEATSDLNDFPRPLQGL